MKKNLISDIRYIFPESGMKGTLHYGAGDAIPLWPEGLEIWVLEVKSPDGVIIKDTVGRLTRVPHFCLNMGREYEMDGVWLPESDPLVLDHLESCLTIERHTVYACAAQEQMDAYKRKLEEILLQHGRLTSSDRNSSITALPTQTKRRSGFEKVSGV